MPTTAGRYLLAESCRKILYDKWCCHPVLRPDTESCPQRTEAAGFTSYSFQRISCLPLVWSFSAKVVHFLETRPPLQVRPIPAWSHPAGLPLGEMVSEAARKSGYVRIRGQFLSVLINQRTSGTWPKLTSIFRGPYLISWAARACLNGVGVLGELSRIDLLIAGVLKL